TASNAKSSLPVPAPLSFLAVGSLIIGRSAKAAGFCWNSDIRFHFAPTQMSPNWLPLHESAISGFCGTTPPAPGRLDTKSGRISRSTRDRTITDANTSARSARPVAKVIGQFETSEKPWLSSKLTRYALTEYFLRGSTSPVGTYHRPVSPMNVVVAGRV